MLYLFCNRTIHPESSVVFQCLLQMTTPHSEALVLEVLAMTKFSSKSACFFLNDLLMSSLKHAIVTKNDSVTDLTIYLVAITKDLLLHQLDPRSNFNLITKALAISDDTRSWNIVLIIFAEMLAFCPIQYIPDLMTIIKCIIVDNQTGNQTILHMIQDGILQILASHAKLDEAESLLIYITSKKLEKHQESSKLQSKVFYYHPDIARAQDICRWLETSNYRVQKVKTSADQAFWNKNVLLLRGLFLSTQLGFSEWNQVVLILMEVSAKNELSKNLLIMPMLYKLANATHPRTKLILLQNMITLGAKDQIFNTLKAISKGLAKPFTIDLYLRLWKVEVLVHFIIANPFKINIYVIF